MSKKLRCDCGKWVARLDDTGNVFVWCKNCKKEVQITPVKIQKPAEQSDSK